MVRNTCLALGVLGLGAAAAAPAAARVGGVVVRWGEVDAVYAGPMSPDDRLKALSPGQTVSDARFTKTTDQIQARRCLRFGVSAWLTAGPGERYPPRVRVVVQHPLTTRPDGASSTEDSFYTPVLNGEVAAFFVFENRWEMQPGAWTFQFLDGDTLLASKSFNVTVPPGAQPSVCEGAPTS